MSTGPAIAIIVAAVAIVVLRRLLGDRSVDATWLAFAKVPFNAVSFRLRRLVGWRRGPPAHANESKADLFDYVESAKARADLTRREAALRDLYDLAPLAAKSSREVYRDNLYVLDLLDRFVTKPMRESLARRESAASASSAADTEAPPVVALDVGSKDFRYAFALERFLRAFASDRAADAGPLAVDLGGVEIDGHPIYPDMRSRADHAEAYAAEVEAAHSGGAASRVRYRVADFLDVEARDVDVVFFFFPFVLRYALVRWGLPLGHFVPDRLFEHATRALRPGGLLVIVNHTEEEVAAQRAILARVDALDVEPARSASSHLVDYFDQLEGRALTVARKR